MEMTRRRKVRRDAAVSGGKEALAIPAPVSLPSKFRSRSHVLCLGCSSGRLPLRFGAVRQESDTGGGVLPLRSGALNRSCRICSLSVRYRRLLSSFLSLSLSLPFPLRPAPCPTLSLALSFPPTLSLSHHLPLPPSPSPSLSLTRSPSLMLSLPLSQPSPSLSISLALSLSLSDPLPRPLFPSHFVGSASSCPSSFPGLVFGESMGLVVFVIFVNVASLISRMLARMNIGFLFSRFLCFHFWPLIYG